MLPLIIVQTLLEKVTETAEQHISVLGAESSAVSKRGRILQSLINS